MKKLLILIFIHILLIGCTLNNTPTSKVEELMVKYQTLDDDIKDEIEQVLRDEELMLEQKNEYRNLLETQYKNMSYEIKDEIIDGDIAEVTVAIEVIDYKKTIEKVEQEYNEIKDYTVEEYNDDKIKRLKEAKEKVNYTLNVDVIKNNDGSWEVTSLSNVDKKKIQGMY